MPQRAVEIILMRQLASYLAMPIMLFDPDGNLLYYNEPAEAILGRRFDETGEMSLEEWYSLFELIAENGSPVPLQARPLVIALQKLPGGAQRVLAAEVRRHPQEDRVDRLPAGGAGTEASGGGRDPVGGGPAHESNAVGYPRLAWRPPGRRPSATAGTPRASKCAAPTAPAWSSTPARASDASARRSGPRQGVWTCC